MKKSLLTIGLVSALSVAAMSTVYADVVNTAPTAFNGAAPAVVPAAFNGAAPAMVPVAYHGAPAMVSTAFNGAAPAVAPTDSI